MPANVGAARSGRLMPRPSVGGLFTGSTTLYPDAATTEFDVAIILTQSNGPNGAGMDPQRDRTIIPGVASVMRNPSNPAFAGVPVFAVEPLENETVSISQDYQRAGFARSMAQALLMNAPTVFARPLILFRWSYGGTGFTDPDTQLNWNPDHANNLYNGNTGGTGGFLAAIVAFLKAFPRAQIRFVVWDQGEEDYQGAWGSGGTSGLSQVWATFFARLRSDLGAPDLPIIPTTLSDAVAAFKGRSIDIRGVPSFLSFSAVADDGAGGQSGWNGDNNVAALGFGDDPMESADDPTHFGAGTQALYRGPRIAKAVVKAETANNLGGAPTAISAPGAITDLAASATKSGYLTLTFTPPGASGGPSNGGAAIRGYVAQISTDGGTTWVASPARFCGKGRDLTGLTNGTAYKVRVAAYNAAGQAPWSNAITATPSAVDLTTLLIHKIKPAYSGSGSTGSVSDAGSAASAITVSNLTFGNDGADYLISNGSTSDLTFPVGTAPTQELTMVGWVYITNLGAPKGIFGEWAGTSTLLRNIRTQYSGAIYYLRTGVGTGIVNSYTIDTTNDVNRWVHVALTITPDGSGSYVWRLYVDGALKGAPSAAQAAATIGDNYRMGYAAVTPFNPLAGRRGAFSVYNRAFDQDAITAHFQAGRAA